MYYRIFEASEATASSPKPLVIFLHGQGERTGTELQRDGTVNTLQVKYHIQDLISELDTSLHNAYLLCPQEWYGGDAEADVIEAMIYAMMRRYHIDPTKIYITGLSAGGGQAIKCITDSPGLYAAAAPLSGANGSSDPAAMVSTPTWLMCGNSDSFKGISDGLYNQIVDAGGTPRLTLIPGMGHGGWNHIYNDEPAYTGFYEGGDPAYDSTTGFYDWLWAHDNASPVHKQPLSLGKTVLIDLGETYTMVTTPDSSGRYYNSPELRDTFISTPDFSISGGFVTTDGERIDMELSIPQGFTNAAASGVHSTALYANDAARDTWYVNAGSTAVVKLAGLTPNGNYRIKLFASRENGASSYWSRYSINGISLDLNARNNVSSTALFPNVVANSDGEISISTSVVPDSGSPQAHLGMIEVTRISSGGSGNIPPLAINDTAITDEDVDVSIDVLANDSDADASPQPLSITGVSTPSNGTAQILNGEILYTPGSGYFGNDSFTYTISDGTDENTATVNVTVNGVIEPPSGGTLFSQDFSSSDLVSDYANAAPAANIFDDISTEADGGTWSITSGALVLDRTGSSSANNGAGFARITDIVTDPDFVKVTLNLSIDEMSTTWSTLYAIELGKWTSISDYNDGGSYANLFERLQVKGSGSSGWIINVGGAASSPLPADGSYQTITWYVNNSGSATSYTGLDGQSQTLANLSNDVWIGNTLAINDSPRTTGNALVINDFRVRVDTSFDAVYGFDDINISDTFDEIPVTPKNTYQTWREARFTQQELADLSISGNDADPDGNGWVNLLEYGFGNTPSQRGGHIQNVDDELMFSFSRDPSRVDLTYEIEMSTTLAEDSWVVITRSVDGAPSELVNSAPFNLQESGDDPIEVSISPLTQGTETRFYRLSVTTD
ncbi:Ig-like domain-containing protein [Cerasicoccus arenae]|uniref:Cadherin-like domain-containing protein n=1 Tax=Cerasicoccus arenae TaxID=424488 RepID=A0A8J3GDQ9_9BACT|nr:Ig-like domain-containing protein [Cerasicoccus arenae]MBK1859853.1 cadherin-like domain-containing protein [Cerasicoccus arenae]GHB93436.1 hypothetical protein GCM10007047_06110 [Cerasicoccus arenae]